MAIWEVQLRKVGSKVTTTICNPEGGSECGQRSSSYRSALAMLRYHTSLGGGLKGVGPVRIFHMVWDPERGDYRTTKEYTEEF